MSNELIKRTGTFLSNIPGIQTLPKEWRVFLISSGFDELSRLNYNQTPEDFWINLIYDLSVSGNVAQIENLLITAKKRVGIDLQKTIDDIVDAWEIYRKKCEPQAIVNSEGYEIPIQSFDVNQVDEHDIHTLNISHEAVLPINELSFSLGRARCQQSAIKAHLLLDKIIKSCEHYLLNQIEVSKVGLIGSSASADLALMENSPYSRLEYRLKAIKLAENANKLSSDFRTAIAYGNRIVDLFYDQYAAEDYDIRRMLASGVQKIDKAIDLVENSEHQAQLLIQKSSVLRCQALLIPMREREYKLSTIGQAIRCTELAEEKSPDNPFTFLEHGQALWSFARYAKNDEEYTKALNSAEEKFIQSQRLWTAIPTLVLSRFYRLTYRPLMALAVFDEYEKREKNRRRLLSEAYILGEAAYQLSYTDCDERLKNYYLNRAYDVLTASMRAGYENARILMSLAIIESLLGKSISAEDTLSKIVISNGDSTKSWIELIEQANKLIENKEYEVLKKVFALGIIDSSIWNSLGTYARKFLNNNEYAIKLYRSGLVLQPRNAYILTNLARVFLYMGSSKDLLVAEKYINEAGKCADRNFRWWREIKQKILQAQGKKQKARQKLSFNNDMPVQFKNVYTSFEYLKENQFEDEKRRNELFYVLFENLLRISLGITLKSKTSDNYIIFEYRAKLFYVFLNWTEHPISKDHITSFKELVESNEALGLIISLSGISEDVQKIVNSSENTSLILLNVNEIEGVFYGSIHIEVMLGLKVRNLLQPKENEYELTDEDEQLYYSSESPLMNELYFFNYNKPRNAKVLDISLSYALEDRDLISDILEYLDNLQKQGVIHYYDLCKIRANQKKARKHIQQSTVNIILISDYFMNSDECRRELEYAIQYFERGDNKVIPIMLNKLKKTLVLDGLDSIPLYQWADLGEVWMELGKKLESIIQIE